MGFGILAHAIGKHPLRELTAKLGGRGIDFVQLALTKAIGDMDTGTGKLSTGMANTIAEQFERAGIRIGVLGCYIDPIHPDAETRRQQIRRFKEHLRYARDFGTSIVATETGSLATYAEQDPVHYEELAFTVLRETVEELAEEAERWGVTVGLEPVCTHTLFSPARMARMLEEVPSSTLGVVLDPVNLLNQDNYMEQDTILEQAFQRIGDRIVLAHLKNFALPSGQGFQSLAIHGEGLFHTDAFLHKLKLHKPFVDISMEELSDSTLEAAISYVRDRWKAV
jgi:sugar phosphate isomerase/epimerase